MHNVEYPTKKEPSPNKNLIIEIIKKLKLKKEYGSDQLRAEMFTHIRPVLIKHMQNLLREI